MNVMDGIHNINIITLLSIQQPIPYW